MDARVVERVRLAGFGGLIDQHFIAADWHLITALVERWRPETHTFHMTSGETTLTLQDVEVLTGLPVDGRPVTGSSKFDAIDYCQRFLGVTVTRQQISGSCIYLAWLRERFSVVPADADDHCLDCHARAYILQLIGGTIFADKSGRHVHLMYLALLADLGQAREFSWGSAALAFLYRELCSASRGDIQQIGGHLVMLQVWAWLRFPHIAPQRMGRRLAGAVAHGPLIAQYET